MKNKIKVSAYLKHRLGLQYNTLAFPSYYAENRCGAWLDWPKYLVLPMTTLNIKNNDFINFEDIVIRSICWGEPASDITLIWDTLNGFRENRSEIFF